jgi:hypothetical protein
MTGSADLVQLDDGAVAERLDLLGPAQPQPLLRLGATPGPELARVEGNEYRVQRRRRRRASVAAERLAQGRPGGAQLLGGGIDAAESLGQGEGAFGLGPVGQEAAGLPAQVAGSEP